MSEIGTRCNHRSEVEQPSQKMRGRKSTGCCCGKEQIGEGDQRQSQASSQYEAVLECNARNNAEVGSINVFGSNFGRMMPKAGG